MPFPTDNPDRGYSLPTLPANGYVGTMYENQQIKTNDQYLRKWTLAVGKGGELPGPGKGAFVLTTETPGYDLRATFKIRHAEAYSPGTAEIRVYNLKETTAVNVINEFNTVVLQAGYVNGHYGIIFQGQIKQFRRGRESAIDSFLDIFAADGDSVFNASFLNKTTPKEQNNVVQQGKDYAQAAADQSNGQVTVGPDVKGGSIYPFGGTMPGDRSATAYGSLMSAMREHGRTTGSVWSVQNGVIQNLPRTMYKPGDIVVINSGTGMIGVPEVTQDGIHVTTLLNPGYWVKGIVKIDNDTLNQYFLPGGKSGMSGLFAYGDYGHDPYQVPYATTRQDGQYCILVIDHEGDTRGQPWYSHLICLNVDPSQPFSLDAVPAAGAGPKPEVSGPPEPFGPPIPPGFTPPTQ